ncbi:MAG: hypothetical protein KQH63_05800 [Desulfobulbaceae bacterium]|nr:hypothetical protein [Desulfobulbaceae bacterium]
MTVKQQRSNLLKTDNSFFTGLLISILLCMLYLKLGYTPPAWLQPLKNVQDFLSEVAVSVFVNEQDLHEIQREIALDFGWNPQKYVELDTALDHFISEEYYWQEQGRHRIMQLQSTMREMKKRKGKYPALDDSLERVLSGLPEDARKEHLFIRNYLKERFPHHTDEEIINKLTTYNINEILQRPGVNRSIHFQPLVSTMVKVEIVDDSGKVVRQLINTELPAGQYWVYWDRTDDRGIKTSSSRKYSYRVQYNGKQVMSSGLDQKFSENNN